MSIELWQRRLALPLAPLGLAYALGMAFRRRLFEDGRLKSVLPSAPCVAVGNLRMGGSGKTPLVRWLLNWAAARDLRAVVLTRGYRAKPPRLPYLIDPTDPRVTPAEAGDEPLMLARACPKARVLVDPLRSRAALWAAGELAPDLYLLDDGFQHLAVRRQVDLTLLTADDLTRDWNRVFPAGPWREDASALLRSTAVLVKARPEAFQALIPRIERRSALRGKSVFPFHLAASGLLAPDGATAADLEGRPYLLTSGVADPNGVEATARELLGRPPEERLPFEDHAPFSPAQRQAIQGAARRHGVEDVVCTPKDAVKLFAGEPLAGARLWSFVVEPAFGPGLPRGEAFPEFWENKWKRLGELRPGRR